MNNTVLNILGFHRSGTSALAGQLNALGFSLGFEIEERSDENPKGFFEHPLVRSINERALGQLKSAWFDWSLTPETLAQRRQGADLASLSEEAGSLLASHFADHDSLLVKDPRMMRMAWFWGPLFEAAEVTVRDIIIIRSPAECAASQVARATRKPEFYGSIATAEGMNALWCADHLLMLEHLATKKRPALTVLHRELMTDPDRTLNAIISHLQIEPDPGRICAAQAAIDRTLYRQQDRSVDGPWGRVAEEFFLALQGSADQNMLTSASAKPKLRSVLHQLRNMQAIIAPAADPMHVAAERERDRDMAVTAALMKTLKAIGLAANRVPADQLGPVVAEIETLISATGRRGLFLGALAVALARSGREVEARSVLEEILDTGRRNPWAEKQLARLSDEPV
ncbi:sulfotransferase [Maricaulis sp.]|uniref:sulfotransferase n=1 Tax=Maricaulis sp. TaxID=1486257 RepID=UPI00261BB71A|nr:sulfotransferase [Maricaulis sp.]MDF1769366.1 sulfotransferase [Maricaulis sp.]